MKEEKPIWKKKICQTPLQMGVTMLLGIIIAYFLIAVVSGLFGKELKG